MYLKEIKAHGFKSFADQISITLDKNITGIVGPNGSGKSNVVDAVRWVLGEQSVKSLRGDGAMTDVIFSGSKSRSPLNSASVSLIFDNSDHYLHLDFDEIVIKRRVYKDGTNEYFLNNEKCRLKDITNILIDSGIAKESFNIVSQGKIDEILSSKPTDRRAVFEEAAGVLKYKKRKEEALHKLDRTHNNMFRVNDIINELEGQIEPLKDQREKALKYITAKEELEGIEIALIANDINSINYSCKDKKAKIEDINAQILSLSTSNTLYEAKAEEYKTKISIIDGKLDKLQLSLVDASANVEKTNGQKAIILERQKYNVEDAKLHNNLLSLKEQSLKIDTEISNINSAITSFNNDLNKIKESYNEKASAFNHFKDTKSEIEISIANKYRTETNIKNRIINLKENIENNSLLPYAVKSILNSPRLKGIHNVFGKVIETNEKYSIAIASALGAVASNIIVDNESSAKEAINYLKENNYGRATFYPLNVIKPKAIDPNVLNDINNYAGYIDIASSLVNYDNTYKNVVSNVLGNIVIVDNIDNANLISKKINYRYKVVTLSGEVVNVGGSITGGNQNKTNSIIREKYDLENAIRDLDSNSNEIKELENKINTVDTEAKNVEDKLYLINREKITIEEKTNHKKVLLNELITKKEEIELEIKGTEDIINGALSKEEEKVLNDYYEAIKEKDCLMAEINNLNKEKELISNELEEYNLSIRKENALFNDKNKELKELEIEVNRMEVKLDNLLNILNEQYSMTFEKASSLYQLEMDEHLARTKVNSLRRIIKESGLVNLTAPEEYDRVSKRYEFLLTQKEDLYKAESTLMEIVSEMDKVMEKEFVKTFEIINTNFKTTFKELFNGGTANLKLTDTNNILDTGIEIVASPPGKKLISISLLSGGEKTLTAISLLFAILKSREVPFCIFDEVEAALDEVNVDSFGKYINHLKNKTQFILITHKKKTMEYVDTLYGITMQESGVSKLVSVKLEELK